MLVFFILASGSSTVTASEISVNRGESIQAAVNNASSGDKIVVGPGNYTENIVITKDDLVIRSESGNPEDTYVTANDNATDIFHVQANNVTIMGVVLANSSNNNFTNNVVSSNGGYGLYMTNSSSNTLNNNTASGNLRGIYLIASSMNMLLNNVVQDNREYGFLLSNSKDNILSGNQISNSGRGIDLSTSEGNIISGNTIVSNNISGIFISSTSNNNAVFNNYLNNVYNADVKEGGVGNVFNTTKTAGPNIVSGQYIGGNFWAKPDGTGFSQTAPDADGDGIADTVYSFSGNVNTDFLPLVEGSESTPME